MWSYVGTCVPGLLDASSNPINSSLENVSWRERRNVSASIVWRTQTPPLARLCSFSRWRKLSTVVSSGMASSPNSSLAKRSMEYTSYKASSTPGSDRLHPCCRQNILNITFSPPGGGLYQRWDNEAQLTASASPTAQLVPSLSETSRAWCASAYLYRSTRPGFVFHRQLSGRIRKTEFYQFTVTYSEFPKLGDMTLLREEIVAYHTFLIEA